MRQVIYKYEVHPHGCVLELPKDYRFLHVGVQSGPVSGSAVIEPGQELEVRPGDSIVVWYLVDLDKPKVKVRLLVMPTGVELPKGLAEYLGTVTGVDGDLVFHLFERFGVPR